MPYIVLIFMLLASQQSTFTTPFLYEDPCLYCMDCTIIFMSQHYYGSTEMFCFSCKTLPNNNKKSVAFASRGFLNIRRYSCFSVKIPCPHSVLHHIGDLNRNSNIVRFNRTKAKILLNRIESPCIKIYRRPAAR